MFYTSACDALLKDFRDTKIHNPQLRLGSFCWFSCLVCMKTRIIYVDSVDFNADAEDFLHCLMCERCLVKTGRVKKVFFARFRNVDKFCPPSNLWYVSKGYCYLLSLGGKLESFNSFRVVLARCYSLQVNSVVWRFSTAQLTLVSEHTCFFIFQLASCPFLRSGHQTT